MDVNSIFLIVINLMLVTVTYFLYRATIKYADSTEYLAMMAREQTVTTAESTKISRDLLTIEQIKIIEELQNLHAEISDPNKLSKEQINQRVKIDLSFMLMDDGDHQHFQEVLAEIRAKLFAKVYDQILVEFDISPHSGNYTPDEDDDSQSG